MGGARRLGGGLWRTRKFWLKGLYRVWQRSLGLCMIPNKGEFELSCCQCLIGPKSPSRKRAQAFSAQPVLEIMGSRCSDSQKTFYNRGLHLVVYCTDGLPLLQLLLLQMGMLLASLWMSPGNTWVYRSTDTLLLKLHFCFSQCS